MPESSSPHTHKLKDSEPQLKEKTTTQVSLTYLTCRTSTYPKTNRAKKTTKTQTKFLSKNLGEKKPPKTQNLAGSKKKKIYQQRKFSLRKKGLLALFLFETNKQTNNKCSLLQRKEDR
jgi:hypothetical protein